MRSFKICILGSSGVGKTSLVQRFVTSLFSDKYLSTVGVKIDNKLITISDEEIRLVIWDLAGEDDFFTIPVSYLRGSAGYFLVIDGTRRNTYVQAIDLQRRIEEEIGLVPFITLINKIDLHKVWELSSEDLVKLQQQQWVLIKSSAKEGIGVEEAFTRLATRVLDARS